MDKEFTNILRAKGVKAKGYGIIPKIVMLDTRLTLEAKGIYSYFCSYAGSGDTAFPSVAKMCNDLGVTKDRYYNHFKLLLECNYITVERRRGGRGVYLQNIYTLVDHPCPDYRDTDNPDTDNPDTDDPDTDDPITDNHTNNINSININNFKNNNKNNNNTHQKNVVVVQKKIQSILRAKISLKQVQSMLDDAGIETIEYYLENWDKFRGTQKTNIVGFFIKAVKEQYPLPQLNNTFANFEQRDYKDEDFEIYYKKM